jgi:hypothetical protein
MKYIPPYKKQKVTPVVPLTPEKDFPALSAPILVKTSHMDFAARVRTSEEPMYEQVCEDNIELLRARWRKPMYETEYIRSDDLAQDRMDELDYYDALEYDKLHPNEVSRSEWNHVNNIVVKPKPRKLEPLAEEVNEEEVQQRITFLMKRLRRNGIQREDKEKYETELRKLQKKLYDSD